MTRLPILDQITVLSNSKTSTHKNRKLKINSLTLMTIRMKRQETSAQSTRWDKQPSSNRTSELTSVDPHTNKFKTHPKSTTPTSMRPLHRKVHTLVMVIIHPTMIGRSLVEVRHNITTKGDMKNLLTLSTKMILKL